jgi:hypothetical protein
MQSSAHALLDPGLRRGTDVEAARHLEQAQLRSGICFEPGIPVEMVGGDIQQHRNVAIEALREVDLIARQLEHIDAAFWQRVLGEDRQADVAAHRRRHARGLEDVVDERGRRRFAVGAGDADDLVRRELGAGAGEELDVADDFEARLTGPGGDGVAVERQAGGYDEAVELAEVRFVQAGDFGPRRRLCPRLFLRVPRSDPRVAGKQRLRRRQPGPSQTVDRIMLAGEGLGRDHLSLRVESPASARTKLTIQKRMTTVGSDQPRCSKWWWIGAMRKTRLPVRL